MIQGQYIRLLLSTTNAEGSFLPVAAAKDLSLHLSATTEDGSTKDVTGDWTEYDITALNYDISTNALVLSDDDPLAGNTAKLLKDMVAGVSDNIVYWQIAYMSGTNNRVVSEIICQGQAKITKLDISAQHGTKSTYTSSLSGFGPLQLGATGFNYVGLFYSTATIDVELGTVKLQCFPRGIHTVHIALEDSEGGNVRNDDYVTDSNGFYNLEVLSGAVKAVISLPSTAQMINIFFKSEETE